MTINMFEGVASGTPRCDIVSQDDQYTYCPRMSVVRARTRCTDCGHVTLSFLCEGHFMGRTRDTLLCYYCKSVRIEIKVS